MIDWVKVGDDAVFAAAGWVGFFSGLAFCILGAALHYLK